MFIKWAFSAKRKRSYLAKYRLYSVRMSNKVNMKIWRKKKIPNLFCMMSDDFTMMILMGRHNRDNITSGSGMGTMNKYES